MREAGLESLPFAGDIADMHKLAPFLGLRRFSDRFLPGSFFSSSTLPAAQFSINVLYRKEIRNKITDPLAYLLVIGVIGVPKYFNKLGKTLRPPRVFGWTTAFTGHAHLLK